MFDLLFMPKMIPEKSINVQYLPWPIGGQN